MQAANKLKKQLTAAKFAEEVLTWQHQHGRHDLPWQQPATPYRVLVSEIMLQQTQVSTVIPYFQRWMQALPTLEALASANEDEVMALWQGLGYYSRARNLQKAARYIVHELNGKFPEELESIQKIPGVGRYTAGAIRSFAYDTYGPIVDGNVRRLFCRIFGIEGPPTSSAVNKELWQYAETLTPEQNNRRFAQGLLDLGATLCTKRNPSCQDCPFASSCVAFQEQRITELPNPKAKKAIPTKIGHFLWIENLENNSLRLVKRPNKGIWASLWSLPEVSEKPLEAELKGSFKHVFSHYKLEAKVWAMTSANVEIMNHLEEANPEYQLPTDAVADLENSKTLNSLGLPTPIRAFIETHWQTKAE